ncbi:hypothetical protein [Bowmanella denitrificans]|uniref:hypothetical protein n=1 Tax=Bowmanella denitrificans TaxID=366582 RepID=UPI000C99D8F5|nr:hypothetical protein [Bowmanella denitrificans]
MNLISLIRRKYVELTFRRYDLRIVEAIGAQQFEHIIQVYRNSGWEITDAYQAFSPDAERWHCKLRKGTSVLECEWQHQRFGSISGAARIINALANEFELVVLEYPTWQ